MAYIRKNVSIKREQFKQLLSYVLQVTESVEVLKEKNDKKTNLTDWIKALKIHSDILEKYITQIAVQNNLRDFLYYK